MESLDMRYNETFQEWIFKGRFRDQQEKDKTEAKLGFKIYGDVVIERYPTPKKEIYESRSLQNKRI